MTRPIDCDSLYRDLLDNCNDLVMSVAPDGRILYANTTWQRLLGYPMDSVGTMTILDLIHPDCHKECMKKFQAILSGKDIGKIETIFVAKDGRKVDVEGNCNCHMEAGEPKYIRGVFRDVTERKAMQARLQQAQNLEAIGLLAGGIAHDFNNLLTCILGLLSVTRLYTNPTDPICEVLKKCEDTCLQGKTLTSKFLTFASGGEPLKRRLDTASFFNALIRRTAKGFGVDADVLLPQDLWPVEADTDQMEVVMRNIIQNAKEAFEAMGAGGGSQARIIVQGDNISIGLDENLEHRSGDFVKISISDNGPGIPETKLPKIFEPYYTTKDNTSEKGLGFGLAICYSVLKRHGGFITAESRQGEGTTLTLFIPRAPVARSCSASKRCPSD